MLYYFKEFDVDQSLKHNIRIHYLHSELLKYKLKITILNLYSDLKLNYQQN